MSGIRALLTILFVLISSFAQAKELKDDEWYISTDSIKSVILIHQGNYSISLLDYDGVSIVRFYGAIDPSSAHYLRYIILSTGPEYVAFSSPGGNFISGLILGELLEDLGVRVVILPYDYCLSSCAYAIMYARQLEIHGLVGFHLPYFGVLPKDITELSDLLSEHANILYNLRLWIIDHFGDDSVYVHMIKYTDIYHYAMIDSNRDLADLKNPEIPTEFTFDNMYEEEIEKWFKRKTRAYSKILEDRGL